MEPATTWPLRLSKGYKPVGNIRDMCLAEIEWHILGGDSEDHVVACGKYNNKDYTLDGDTCDRLSSWSVVLGSHVMKVLAKL